MNEASAPREEPFFFAHFHGPGLPSIRCYRQERDGVVMVVAVSKSGSSVGPTAGGAVDALLASLAVHDVWCDLEGCGSDHLPFGHAAAVSLTSPSSSPGAER